MSLQLNKYLAENTNALQRKLLENLKKRNCNRCSEVSMYTNIV